MSASRVTLSGMGKEGVLAGEAGELGPRRKGDIPLFDFKINHPDGDKLSVRYAPPDHELPFR